MPGRFCVTFDADHYHEPIDQSAAGRAWDRKGGGFPGEEFEEWGGKALVVGKRCTMIEADDHGGYCHGTGRRISADNSLLITLAGSAYETGYGLGRPVFETAQAVDIDEARTHLSEYPYLRTAFMEPGPDGTLLFFEGDRLLEKWFDRACGLLCPFSGVVEHLGWRLEQRGTMSARSVAVTIREAVKREGPSWVLTRIQHPCQATDHPLISGSVG